jgi:hypothetical protein
LLHLALVAGSSGVLPRKIQSTGVWQHGGRDDANDGAAEDVKRALQTTAVFAVIVLWIIFRPRPDVWTDDAYIMVHYASKPLVPHLFSCDISVRKNVTSF